MQTNHDRRVLRPSRRLKRAHRDWRRFLDEPASAAPLVAPPSPRFHLMNCPSVRLRTFPLKHVHCGNAVTPIDVASGPVLRSSPFAAGALHVLRISSNPSTVRTQVLPARGLL